nr:MULTISPECIES: GMC family oxidoreductase N-terminal domain-containing protein [unclassified Salipiger]
MSADPKCRVLLLEAAGSDNYHWVHIAVGYLYCVGNPRTDWMMTTAAEPGLNGRRLAYPRGTLLGGCSSVNGLICMRGHAADYDLWRQLGNPGWASDDGLPYFIKSQDHHAGASPLHGAAANGRCRGRSWSGKSCAPCRKARRNSASSPAPISKMAAMKAWASSR